MRSTKADQRRHIRVNGQQSLADVVRAVFADVRVLPLVADLNPTLPTTGMLAAAAVVVCPARAEAQAFAARMGFVLGFDERGANGTGPRRAWLRLMDGAAVSTTPVDPVRAAHVLLESGVGVVDVARRLVGMCDARALEEFAAARLEPRWHAVQRAVAFQLAWPRANARVMASIAALDATLRPGGLCRLLDAAAAEPGSVGAVLSGLLLPDPECRALLAAAPRVSRLAGRARAWAKLERGARDLALSQDAEGPVLRAFCEAVDDGVEPLAGDRLAMLGLDKPWRSVASHLEQLKARLKSHQDLLSRAGADVVLAIARDEPGHRLPRPWPLVAAVTRTLGPLVDSAGALAIDNGIGGLLVACEVRAPRGKPSREPTSAQVVTVAALQARAAHAARSLDEGTALAERVAPTVSALLAALRPVIGDRGGPSTRRSSRRSHYDAAMLSRGTPHVEGIAVLVDDVIGEATRRHIVGAGRLSSEQRTAVREIAKTFTGTLSLDQRGASELARALVLVALAMDPDAGRLLLRSSGREAFRALAERHAGRVLAVAASVFANGAADEDVRLRRA